MNEEDTQESLWLAKRVNRIKDIDLQNKRKKSASFHLISWRSTFSSPYSFYFFGVCVCSAMVLDHERNGFSIEYAVALGVIALS